MATYYFRNTGNTAFATATNWSLTSGGASAGVVPTSTDTAIFDGNSGDCTLSTGTALFPQTVAVLNFTGYARTFNLTGHFAVTTALTLGSGMIFTASAVDRTFRWSNGCTVTSNGVYMPCTIFGTSGAPLILVDDLECYNAGINNGVSNFNSNISSSSTTTRYLKIRGNVHMTGVCGSSGTNTVIFKMIGTGSWRSGGYNLNAPIEIDAGSGTITFIDNAGFSNNSVVYSMSNFKYTSGNVITTGVSINFAANSVSPYKIAASGITFESSACQGFIQCIEQFNATTLSLVRNNNYNHFWTGSYGFNVGTLNVNTGSGSTGGILNLTTGINYQINKLLNTVGSSGSKPSILSISSSVLATMTLKGGSNCPYTTFTKIDASNGVYINTFGSTITDCKNIGISTQNILI